MERFTVDIGGLFSWRSEPKSLERAARQLKRRFDQTTRCQRAKTRLRLLISVTLFDARGALLVVVSFALLPALLPLNTSLPLSAAARHEFLLVLWQVEAATVALTITIVLFVFQVFSSRSAASVREFAEDTGFFPVFYSGVSAIGLTGFVILGYGFGGANGWAGLWSAIWSAIGLTLLSILFVTAVQAIDLGNLKTRRIKRARSQVDAIVDNVILERVAHHLLTKECESTGIEPGWFIGGSGAGTALTVLRPGRVDDINLRTLRQAARKAKSAKLPAPCLLVKLGSRVGPSTEWLKISPSLIDALPRITHTLTIRENSGANEQLRQTLEELHEEALTAIAAPAPSRYKEIVDTYVDIVLRLPEAWGRYGQQLETDVGVSSDLFDWTFLDTLRNNAYEEVLHALASRDRDIAQEILNFPLEVATRAIQLRAFALARSALEFFLSYHFALLRSSHPHRDVLEPWLYRRLREYADFHIEPALTRDGTTLEQKRDAEQAMGDAFGAFAEIMKAALDHDPRDTASVLELNREWSTLFRYWEPEYRAPKDYDVDALERERGSTDPEVQRLRVAVEENAELIAMKDRLVRLRQLHRFGLCFWTLRQFQATQEQAWLQAFEALAGYFSSPIVLTTAVADAIQHEWDHHGPWSKWILNELPSGVAHMTSPEPFFITTFIVLALRQFAPDEEPPGLPPIRNLGMHLRTEKIGETIRRVLANETLSSALPDLSEERGAKLEQALETLIASVARADEDRTIAAPLDLEAVALLTAKAREEWTKRRLIRAAFTQRGRVTREKGVPPETMRHRVFGWHPKGFFLQGEGHVFGGEGLASRLVHVLASDQTDQALRLAGLDAEPEAAIASPAEQVRAVIADMREQDLDPQLVLIPTFLSLPSDLQVEPAVGWGGELESPSWFPENSRVSFRGQIDGVAVAGLNLIPPDRIAICDFGGFGAWREWQDDDGLCVNVAAFNAEQARAYAEQEGADEKTETATRNIQLRVRISAEATYEVIVENKQAVRWIALAEPMTD